ncbi:MAG: hypothetical protein AVDCRST_MAG14-1126 [uncultured Rubrobacteraceae bacterium]|uniref:Gram-positive cocci surface proteins LPxTG domain-containing protein n=1 Tax=uncultured Rubrobacteraceae bacterium TaxID=349277 RepID=A0A6J4QUL0_9ACTN|nr:MAG: hypothetical protein AVDCRST_MAG14-1126 [uncultured Rubrobacteraceae bacterium]
MRKLMLLAALLAIALVVAAPAMAQSVSQVVQSTGGNVSCSVVTQNGQTIVQVSGMVNGVQVSDTFPVAGSQVSVDCQQLLQQAAAAKASKAEAEPAPVPELPKTGGAIPPWGLGAGVLLVAEGLLVRRLTR